MMESKSLKPKTIYPNRAVLFLDEYSTYGFITEELITRAGFVIEKIEYLSEMYAQYTCIKA